MTIRFRFRPSMLLAAALLAGPALAQTDHQGHHPAPAAPAAASPATPAPAVPAAAAAADAAWAEAEVRRVDVGAGKVTLKHGDIQNLGMPPMTMVFRVQDATMLDKVAPGDNIRFLAERVNGAITVTRLETIK